MAARHTISDMCAYILLAHACVRACVRHNNHGVFSAEPVGRRIPMPSVHGNVTHRPAVIFCFLNCIQTGEGSKESFQPPAAIQLYLLRSLAYAMEPESRDALTACPGHVQICPIFGHCGHEIPVKGIGLQVVSVRSGFGSASYTCPYHGNRIGLKSE